MSATSTAPDLERDEIARTIEDYLVDVVNDGFGYFKSKEIAADTELGTKQVAAVLPTIDNESDAVTVEQWARTKSVTWLVETVE